MPPVRIVIAEDNDLFRELLREQLQHVPDLEVIGEARNGWEAISVVGRLSPDMLTLDLNLEGLSGLEVLTLVRWYRPDTKVIILSGHDEESTIREALRGGARGYIAKSDQVGLERVIQAVRRGEVWARRRVLATLIDDLVSILTLGPPAVGGEPAPA